MAVTEQIFLYLGVYFDEQAASDDEGVLRDRQLAGAMDAYEATVISRGEDGHVRHSPRSSSWTGICIAAVVALIFPISAIELDSNDGTCIVRRERPADVPSNLNDFAAILNNGQSALAVIGGSTLADCLAKADLRAFDHVTGPIELHHPVRPEAGTRAMPWPKRSFAL